jgi:hypothetical protein
VRAGDQPVDQLAEQLTEVDRLGAVPVPFQPYTVLAPEPSVPFHSAFPTDSALPDSANVPDQPCTDPLLGSVREVFQELMALDPAVTVTEAE